MSALEAHEHIQTPRNEPVSPVLPEAHDAKIIPFPVAGVGAVAVGASAGSSEVQSASDPPVFADNGIAVQHGTGGVRRLRLHGSASSVPLYSDEYNKLKSLHNKRGLL